tara:strand:- start:19422 stop:21440 length:2019 start_codon:yes stop_codon:yes gene_type:complete
MSFIPKQALDNALAKGSVAVKELNEKVDISITERIAAEGSTINVTVGNEKDGFTSLTAATTKGNANEGPAIAIMGANIKQGSITKTVAASAKLSSVTGGTKGQSAVLNETIVQASPKGITKAFKSIVQLNDRQIEAAIAESSPIPSQAKNAVKTELSGGVAAKAGAEVEKKSIQVSVEVGKPFGSINPFGSVGSSFGNIMAQVTSQNSSAVGKFTDPLKAIKSAGTDFVKDLTGATIPTPNLMNGNGTTNLALSVAKSKLENLNVKRLPDTIKPGQRTNGYKGIATKLKGYNYGKYGKDHPAFEGLAERESKLGIAEGGNYLIPMTYGRDDLKAEILAMEREFTNIIIRHHVKELPRKYEAEDIHIAFRKKLVKQFGEAAVTADPKTFVFPAHLFVNRLGNIKIMTPFNQEIPKEFGKEPVGDNVFPGSLHMFIEGSGGGRNKISQQQLKTVQKLCKIVVTDFPGIEILGLKDVHDHVKYSNVPYFNVRDFMASSFDKPSVTEENERAVVPPAKDLVDAKPKNIVLPPKPHTVNARPSISRIAGLKNREAAPQLTSQQYQNNQKLALDLLKSKKSSIAALDLATGSGLTTQIGIAKLSAGTSLSSAIPGLSQSLISKAIGGPIGSIAGSIVGNIARSATQSDGLLKSTQQFKLDNLKNNKVFDSVKGIFKDG